MLETLASTFYKEIIEREFVHSFGIVLIKPDSIDLGVDDYIISRFAQELSESKAGTLRGVYQINVKKADIPFIYPSMPKDGYIIVEDYLTESPSVLLTFKGSSKSNLQDRINKIKGKRLGDWSVEEIDGKNGFSNSVRGMLPVPGTIEQFKPVIERIKLKKADPSIRFSDNEYGVYCKNLVHSPNDYMETFGLLRLLSQQQLNEVLNFRQYLLFTYLINQNSHY